MHTISGLIAREHETIMARWLEQARHAASACRLDQPAPINLMPRYLASLSAAEDGGELVEHHFAARLRQGFQLAEIVDEFALLGRCIVERSGGSGGDAGRRGAAPRQAVLGGHARGDRASARPGWSR